MHTYRFGDFELDLEAMQLRHGSEPVKLERRPLDLLVLLVSRRGTMVARDDIVAALWPPKVIIDFDSGVNTLVRKVRHALGDTSEHPRYIETVPGRGYRFIAPVTELPAAPAPQSEVPAPAKPDRRRWPAAAAFALLAVATFVIVWQSATLRPEHTRIAVLPFDNLTGREDLGYMARGLADETGASLAQIDLPGFAVIGMVSAQALADANLSIEQIGRDYDVDYVVVSSLQLDQPKIRVTSRLIRVAGNLQVWSASFDRELTNVLGLQRELSIAIAEQVRQRLSPDVAAAIDRRQTQNPAAYELYLRGRDQWRRLSPSAVRQAMQYFREAVAIDPDYALAWAGISHVASTSLMVADAEPAAAIPVARDALQHALQSDPELAEVQYAKAYIHLFIEWDHAAAEEAGRRAMALDPNSAIACMLVGMTVFSEGRLVEARDLLRRARELDPLFALAFANSAPIELRAGDPKAALEFARQAVAIGPENWAAHFHLGNSLRALGDLEAALAAYADAERYSGGNSKPMSARARLLIRLGREDEAREVLAQMTARTERGYFPPYALAVVYAGLGDGEASFRWLEQAVAAHDVHVIGFDKDDEFRLLHDDPRYPALVARYQRLRNPSSAR